MKSWTDPVSPPRSRDVSDEWLAEAAKLLAGTHNPFRDGPNLLPHGDFETAGAAGLPDGWKIAGNESGEGAGLASGWRHVRDASRAHGGEGFVFLDAQAGATGEPRWRTFDSLVAEVEVKPNTYYRLSGWIRTEGIRGRAFLRDNVSEERSNFFSGDSDWEKVDLFYNTGSADRAEIALALSGSNGSVSFDDLKFVEMLPRNGGPEVEVVAGLASRGERLFWNHPVASCVNCHALDGQGSSVGPALDGIASRFDETYLLEALVEPNAALAEGYDAVPVSAMPPMGQILTPQELADVLEFLKTLKI